MWSTCKSSSVVVIFVIMNIVDKYLQLINRTYYGLSVVYPETIQQKFRPPFLIDLIETIQYRMEMNNYYWMEIISIVVCIILLAIIRYVLVNKFIIKQLRHYRLILGHHDHHRFGNNLWNCLFYMHTFTLSWWIMANIGCLEYPKRFWINNSSDIYYGGQTSMIIMYLYLIDISNYIYSMIYLCKNYRQQLWDKDSPMIIIHHLAAILLFTLSHMINMHRMGVAIIFLLEISEIFYFLRCMVKLQIHFIQRWQNSIRFIGFTSMCIVWLYNRLYRYPLIILTSVIDYGYQNLVDMDRIAIYILIYYLLLLIQLFNIYGSFILIKLIIRIYSSGLDKLEDVREIRCQR
ncbi:Ceramide synthase 1 [Dermatophagoides farinae]|uniref:Ceramide synthase 1 n=1 Tax=Dermatophagoides farinae TaxID=6954 RepID=A0A922KXX6_DERFA|nr:Ceramide synthase 1 [Dermatophagoides farinae]